MLCDARHDAASLSSSSRRRRTVDRNRPRLHFSTIGTPLDPRNVLRAWRGLLAKVGVERRPFHAARHTAARLLLAEGAPVKVVQEVLGHSLHSTTADIYGHLVPQAFAEGADAMDRALAASE
jgi:integrase